ncbi:MAG TPA: TRAP transporter large permease subunit [Alphaproteobacteria bacterium]|nr:TRAP transporter large permease subunit [Alphaproteobacteria bacterium]
MDWTTTLGLLLGLLVLFMATGLPVAFAFLAVNIVGAFIFLGGEAGLIQIVRNAVASLSNFTLAPIPLFLLMGEVLFHTGLAYRAIDATNRLISRLPGRLSIVSVIGGTIFASLSGSSIANTAMLGSSLLPEMLKRGYAPSIAMGPIMATGGIAMLIPPSALAVLLGSLAGISISQLLIAGIVPGVVMSVLFFGYIITRCLLNPALAPEDDGPEIRGWDRIRPFLVHVVPLFAIFVVVVGSMIAGWATPTEAAALGCTASVIAAAAYRALTWAALWKALEETTKIAVMILFIIVGSITFSQILSFSGAARGLVGVVETLDLAPFMVILVMVAILLFLGCFMDQVSMLMVTIPFFLPIAQLLGIDLIWLGVLMLICMEVGFLTPPFGLLIFVMKGVVPPGIHLGQIYAAAMPFLILELLVLAAILAFPALATWLPAIAFS